MDLTPLGEPPYRGSRWCPSCCCWWHRHSKRPRRRCVICHTALVRSMPLRTPREGELRPGIVAEFRDPRDVYDATGELAALRARLRTRHVG